MTTPLSLDKIEFEIEEVKAEKRIADTFGQQKRWNKKMRILETARMALKENACFREALNKIRCSAPCKEGHESFNTPGQLCDQRLAEEALAPFRSGDSNG